jgi:hypothetical protein
VGCGRAGWIPSFPPGQRNPLASASVGGGDLASLGGAAVGSGSFFLRSAAPVEPHPMRPESLAQTQVPTWRY